MYINKRLKNSVLVKTQDTQDTIIDFDFKALYPSIHLGPFGRKLKLYWMLYNIKEWLWLLFRRATKPFRYLYNKLRR